MRRKVIRIPIYKGRLVLIQAHDFSYIQERYGLPDDISGYDGLAFRFREDYVIAFLGTPKPGVVAHESLHIVNEICKTHIIHLSLDNDEPQAYLLEWIVDECFKFLKI
jgi:hypothetical protein